MRPRATTFFLPVVLVALSGAACGSSGTSPPPPADGGSSPQVDGGAPPPSGALATVFLIVMENHDWSDIKGSSSAPYINGTLLPMASHAEKYFDNPAGAHPSEPNYLWLEGGTNFGVLDDNDPAQNHQGTTDHLVTLLAKAGVSWKAWVEDIEAGKCPVSGSGTTGLFAPKHTPMLFFDDVVGSPPSTSSAPCIANVVPYDGFAAALQKNTVARYNFITPNLCHDMHNDTGCNTPDAVKNGDDWLAANVPAILASQAYKQNGALFITWDESEGGEAPIGMIVLSPKAKGGGYANTTTQYYHSSMLRTVEEIFGVTPLLRDAANQPDLADLFTSFP